MRRRDGPSEIAVLDYPGAQLSAVYGLTDLFAIANEHALLLGGPAAPTLRVSHWRLAGPTGTIEKSFDSHPAATGSPVAAIVPPSLAQRPEAPMRAILASWLSQQHASGAVVCSVCAGAFLLAETGLLDGRTATTHWSHAAELARQFPAVRVEVDRLIVDDGDVITAGGVMSWTDLGLRLVERTLGPTVTIATSRFLLFDPAGREQRHYSRFAPRLDHGDELVRRVQAWLTATGAREVSLPGMAGLAGLEPRTFQRRFARATGLRPTEYCQQIRIGRARDMLEGSTATVGQIAWDVGYRDEASFRKVFQRVVGLAPGAYRRRFRLRDMTDPALTGR